MILMAIEKQRGFDRPVQCDDRFAMVFARVLSQCLASFSSWMQETASSVILVELAAFPDPNVLRLTLA
jgi:hypothetical protein